MICRTIDEECRGEKHPQCAAQQETPGLVSRSLGASMATSGAVAAADSATTREVFTRQAIGIGGAQYQNRGVEPTLTVVAPRSRSMLTPPPVAGPRVPLARRSRAPLPPFARPWRVGAHRPPVHEYRAVLQDNDRRIRCPNLVWRRASDRGDGLRQE